MKILIDECLPVELRFCFPDHDCVTVQYLKAKGAKDNTLLRRTISDQIDLLLTIDGNMAFQQNFKLYPRLAVIFLKAISNDIDDLRPLLARINLELRQIKPGEHIYIP